MPVRRFCMQSLGPWGRQALFELFFARSARACHDIYMVAFVHACSVMYDICCNVLAQGKPCRFKLMATEGWTQNAKSNLE